jgi:hypothetical protein
VPYTPSTEWQQYTRGRYYRVLELMHRPFLFAILHESEVFNSSVTIRSFAEKCLLNALRYLQHSQPRHRHHGLWLQLRNQLKMASLLAAASKSIGAAVSTTRGTMPSMPEGWEEAVSKTLSTFKYWSWEFPPAEGYLNVLLAIANAPTDSLVE